MTRCEALGCNRDVTHIVQLWTSTTGVLRDSSNVRLTEQRRLCQEHKTQRVNFLDMRYSTVYNKVKVMEVGR